MNRDTFEKQYQAEWQRFEALLEVLEARNPKNTDPATKREDFPELYRRICQQLALARARAYGTDLEQRLNRLALRAHQQLYRRSNESLRNFFGKLVHDFPRTVRREARLFFIAAALLYVPQLSMQLAVYLRPELVYTVLDPATVSNFESMYQSSEERASSSDFLMFGYYIRNNISVAFRTFASGILFGVGTVFFLVLNGVMFGAVAGHVQNQGLGDNFFPFVIGHGSFEITAIVLAGLCGLKLGGAVLMPGRETRTAALRQAAHSLLPVIYGLIAFLVIAAFIEAFWSSTPTPPMVRYLVGAGLWTLVGTYLIFVGREGANSP